MRYVESVWSRVIALGVVVLSLTASLVAQQQEYRVGAKDILAITVWNQLSLSGKFPVDDEGAVTFPLIGPLQVAGLTLKSVETELKRRLADGFFNDPQVSVSVDEFRSQRVFIVGEVDQPGTFSLTGSLTLIEALSLAKSTSPNAAAEVIVLRPKNKQSGRPTLMTDPDKNDAEVIRVDLAALQNGRLSNNITLQDGDTLFVPKAETVFVFGQVRSPGTYRISSDTTVVQVLALAGGVAERGASNRIRIIRVVAGEKKELKANLNDVVRANDTIIVPDRFF